MHITALSRKLREEKKRADKIRQEKRSRAAQSEVHGNAIQSSCDSQRRQNEIKRKVKARRSVAQDNTAQQTVLGQHTGG